jgi:hypothetical protein
VVLQLVSGYYLVYPVDLELELENSGRQNYEKLFHISMNFW